MPDLVQSLQGRDLGHLRIIAELWGLEFSAPDAKVGLQRLAPILLDYEALSEALQTVPERAQHALGELLRSEGRLPWAAFERRFGAVREMGAARRDRERPFLGSKASVSEALWYRGLIARGFFDSATGPQEFAYVPDDLLILLADMPAAAGGTAAAAAMGRLATPAEKAVILPGSDAILDDACTLLAALRSGLPEYGLPQPPATGHYLLVNNPHLPYALTIEALLGLLNAAGLLDEQRLPRPEPVRRFLEAGRGEALLCLAAAWLRSASFNDLRLMPGVTPEGEWSNDPLRARRAILDYLSTVPGAFAQGHDPAERPFWSVQSLITAVHQSDPDFQRSAGEYDTWFLRDNASGQFLRGFEHWNEVEGELVRFVIAGPLHWLGVVDLGMSKAGRDGSPFENGGENGKDGRAPVVSAFRFTPWAASLLNLQAPGGLHPETDSLAAGSDGRLRVPRLARRSLRYQVARFADWERIAQDVYIYRLTPGSLQTAGRQGLRAGQLMTLLRRYSQPVPPSLVQALERWEKDGSAARVERLVVLRVKNPELLQTLRSSRLSRYLGEPLGPAAVVVRPGAVDKLVDGLAEMGYLGEIVLGGEQSL